MGLPSRALVACLVCCCVGLVVWPAGAWAEELSVGGGSLSLSGGPIASESMRALTGSPGESTSVSPEAERLNSESEVAYEGLSASESEGLASRAFPAVIDESGGGPPPLRVGQTFEGFPTDNAMSVLDEGRQMIVESLQPIAVEQGPGRVPIDLSLSEAGGHFAPKTPVAGAHLSLPRRLSEGPELSDLGIVMTPVDEHGASLTGEGSIDGATVFYANDQGAGVQDLSTLVKPMSGGMDVVSVLYSKLSPERLYFKVGLPEGASLLQEGSGPVRVVFASRTIASIEAPVGRDAEGRPVHLTLSAAGDIVTVAVARTSGLYKFPLMVDPYVTDEELTGSPKPTNWKFCASDDPCEGHSSGKFRSVGWGGSGGLTTEPVGGYEPNQWVALQYQTQGESKIEEWYADSSGSSPSGNVESFAQLANGEKTEDTEQLGTPPSTSYSAEIFVCPRLENGELDCKGGVGKGKNFVRFEQTMSGSGSGFADTLSNARVEVTQNNKPEAGYNTTAATLSNGKENVLYGSGKWLGPHSGGEFEVLGKDPGIGVSALEIEVGRTWSLERSYLEENLCAGVQCDETAAEQFEYAPGMPDGEDSLWALARNATVGGMSKEVQGTLKVDGAPPNGLQVTGLPSNGVVSKTVELQAQATDGSGTTPSSGVKSLELGVDGYSLLGRSGSCEPGPCSAAGEWTLNPEEFGAGKHKIELVATDNVGNKEVKTYEITVHHDGGIGVGPGSVEPVTGALTLGASDVSIGGGEGALGVSRSFDSHQLKAGAQGPFGPQWSIAISGEQGIESAPIGGSVNLVGPDGSRTTFTSDGKGGFVPPKGDENLVLSVERSGETVIAYLLKDPTKGTTLRFVHPAGAGSNSLWVLEKAEGALSKANGEQQTYTWEVAEGVERPTQALAPVPSGVSCKTELKPGCRALSFAYGTETKATGEAPGEWGEYKGRLMKVSFTAYNPAGKAMETKPVAEYAYDKQGRLRAEWDPRISPALKTTYGYDAEGRVVAVNPPGQEPWLLHYGTIASDPSTVRLLSTIRPSASTALGSGAAPADESKPTLSSTTPTIGTTLSVASNGSWSGSPLAYTYQWQDCDSKGEKCATIAGAVNESYTPVAGDAGYTLAATVTAVNADGSGSASTVASSAIALSTPKYALRFGSLGAGAGQVKNPAGVAIDTAGNVWVSDHNNNRLEEFSSSGAFVETLGFGVANGEAKLEVCTSSCRAGIAGSGSGQFSSPDGIAIAGENIYIADAGNNRIQELNTKGEFVRDFGSNGSGPGQLKTPVAVAIGPIGNVWVADAGNNRIDKFTESGASLGAFGSVGTGLGQFKEPSGIAFSGQYAYVADAGNNRVQQWSLLGYPVAQFGTAGSGNGQFSKLAEIATEPVSGDLLVADNGNNRVQELNSAGTFLASVGGVGEGEGQFKGVEGIALTSSGTLYAADLNNNRVEGFAPTYSTNNPAPQPPSVGSSAVSTVEYQVPVSGSGAPYALGEKEVEEGWAQKDIPIEATAVFPPDEPMGWPAKDYKRASISYFDSFGRTVNTANPSGGISTSEYNETNDVTRTLSAPNRAQALKEGAKSAEIAKLLDTQSTYNAEGTELLSTLGPEHKVKLGDGIEVRARKQVKYFYDEGAPTEGGPYQLVTKTIEDATYSEGETDLRTTIDTYSGQENLGWLLGKPTSVTTDPAGLKLTSTTFYEPRTGRAIETRSPESGTSSVPAGTYAYSSQLDSAYQSSASLTIPLGITVDSLGNIWVADTGNNRVQEFSASGQFIQKFGTAGTGNLQFKEPSGISVDSKGDVWVTDTGNNRVQEFSSTGAYLAQFGTEGKENVQFKSPRGVAVDSKGDVWVTDTGNDRVQEFSSTGTYLAKFGTEGKENGQFKSPYGVAVDSKGNVWVTDTGNDRVQEFSSTGTYLAKFGTEGKENGQFKSPYGIAVDSKGGVWVADQYNARVQEFSSTGTYLAKFGTEGKGNGQFELGPTGVAVTPNGNLWVGEFSFVTPSRVQEFSTTGEYMGVVCNATTLKNPEGIAAVSGERIWIANTGADRIEEFSTSGVYVQGFGSQGTGNGQFKNPRGIAVDSSGNIWVVDSSNDRVQEFSSTGVYIRQFGKEGSEIGQFKNPHGIAIDPSGNVWIADTGDERIEEFSSTGTYIRRIAFLEPYGVATSSAGDVWVTNEVDTVGEYSPTGESIRTFAGGTNGIVLDSKGNVWTTSLSHVVEFTPTGEQIRQFGVEGSGNGQLKKPTGLALGSNGSVWVQDTGNNRVQQFTETPGGPHTSQTIYYTSAPNLTSACGKHPEWEGLPCQSQPAQQPSKGNPLPVVTDTYDMWDESETVTETFGSTTRTKKSSYDAAGRLTGSEVTSTLDTALPKVTDEYSPETGAMIKQSTTVGEKTQTIASVYNRLGELTEYTDADHNKSTYVYDVDGRVSEINDGKGTQTYAYDPTTGTLTKLLDSSAKMFTAGYDIKGRMTSETYPNGMSAKYVYDEAGEITHVEYVKEAHCAGTCPEVWFSEAVVYSVHGEAVSRTSTLASEEYLYDAAGRLIRVQETPAGKGCTTRVYAYDQESNRLSLTTRAPGVEGKCATEGGTVESHTYDEANRLSDTGTSYDAFGNTLALPAADAEGHEIKSTYYVSNQTHSTAQNGKTITYELDPEARSREIVTEEGSTKTSVINHYPGPGGAVAWTDEGAGKYTRNIPGIDGSLGAVEKSGEAPVLQLHDLQGNIVATAALSETETKVLSTYNSTEFGVPVNGTPPTKYSWLGASGVSPEFSSGASASGGAGYVPQLGRPLQTQPINPPGAAPTGTWALGPYTDPSEAWTYESDAAWGAGSTGREAARQEAAAAEACQDNPESCWQFGEDPPEEGVYFTLEEATLWYNTYKANGAIDFAYDFTSWLKKEVLKAPIEWAEKQLGLHDPEEWADTIAEGLYECITVGEFFQPGDPARCRVGIPTINIESKAFDVDGVVVLPKIKWFTIPDFRRLPNVELCAYYGRECISA